MVRKFYILFLIIYILLFSWFWSVDSILKQTGTFLWVYGIINLFYLGLIYLIFRIGEPEKRIALSTALVIGIMLLLIPRADISTDIYTYLWDGWMVNLGISPYIAPPSAEMFKQFHSSELYQLQYWKGELSVYPPLAQIVFSLVYLGYSLFGLVGAKIILALPLIILSVYLFKILNPKLYSLFVLNPLLLFEAYYSAHIDSWMVLFSTLAIIFYFKNRFLISSTMLGGAITLKILPAMFLPLILFDLIKRRLFREIFCFSVMTVALVGFMYWIFYIPGTSFLKPFQNIISINEFNATFYRYVKEGAANVFNIQLSSDILSKLSLSVLGLAIITLLTRGFSFGVAVIVGIIFLLVSPTIYPWYLMFLVPLVFLYVNQTKQYYWLISLAVMGFLFGITYFQQVDFKPYEMKIMISNKITDLILLIFLTLSALGIYKYQLTSQG